MNRLAIIFLLFISVAAHAQERENRQIPSFNHLKVSEGIKVYLHQSNTERLEVEARNVGLDEVETEVIDDLLKISLSGNRHHNVTVRVDVYYKNIESIDASSASSVFSEQVIKGDNFVIDVSSAASVDVKVDVYKITIDASSSGDVKVAGKSHNLSVDVSSAGGINAYELISENAVADASSAGSAKIYVTKSLRADASSGGSIRYKGNPHSSNVDSSSGGSVRKSD